MRKTILIAATACLLMVSGVYAENRTTNESTETILNVKDLAISSFCKAILQGDIDTVKSLIELGEDVNQKSLDMTPAMFAARYNKADILQLLIENGADLSIKNDKGYTAKKLAKLSHATEALAVLEGHNI
ncbi:ankyrin repeat domain-containing protein [uncultured Eudoraea sp.]|jgi:ankyrin repeat protein|uniref:ankyrin repeat domain-containing protein n=1 Tax=uncultured Eudoraea sp. TaxID=1035614 RepID=UPI002625C8A5|nr:ankyrin repeat domain-containing protein [uncultured Eudoraea sp.]